MRNIILVFAAFLLGLSTVAAQFQDDFSDGDFTQNPIWTGNTTQFEVNSQKYLHLISSGADTSTLSTTSSIVLNTEWRFFVKQSFNSSSNNHSRVYLVSNKSNLTDSLNGYFVQIGSTQDNITLWRQSGNNLQEIITGTNISTGNSVNEIYIKVICDINGKWELFADNQGGTNYTFEGSITDNTFTTSGYFGVFCKYTSSNSTKFYFDDFYVGAIQVDTLPPELMGIKIISQNKLQLFFNETVELNSSQNIQNYIVDGSIGNPASALRLNSDSTIVDLTFTSPFTYAQAYQIELSGIKDNNNNAMPLMQSSFMWYYLKQGDIVINEIMADPMPSVGLPDAEYIELYNNSGIKVNLKDWVLKIGNSKKTLGDAEIPPKSYIIIGHDNNESLLSQYGNFLGLSSFSLTNSGTSLLLTTDSNRFMHHINYNTFWYQNAAKEDGGWSLEQIDPNNYCGAIGNWSASASVLGGSPGQKNSVDANNPDTDAPYFNRVVVVNSMNIDVFLSEAVDSIFAKDPMIYNISDGIGNPIEVIASYPEYSSFSLKLSSPLLPEVIYNLTIDPGVSDCAGNTINNTTTISFGLAQMPDSNDVLINEILFNPKNDGVDYVEIYNNSDKIIDLRFLRLANWNTEDENYDNVEIISEEGFQIFPYKYYVLTTSSTSVKEQYYVESNSNIIEMDALPSLNNTSGNIYLLSNSLRFIDGMNYDEDMHYALLNNPEGISLERLSFSVSSFETTNWHSAAIPGLNAESYGGTPTYINSQASSNNQSQNDWSVYPEIFSPDNDGYEDYLQIQYKLNESGYTANITIYDASGKLIRSVAKNQLLEIDGYVIWDGLNDDKQKADIGIYLILIETYNLNGIVEQRKLTVVLGGKL